MDNNYIMLDYDFDPKLCLCARLLERAQFKPWGVKKQAQLITKLRTFKKDNNLEEGMYKAMYPTGCVPPKFYGLPKIHKTGNPLRPIVSCRGLVTYGVTKVLRKVLKALVGKSPITYKVPVPF